MKSIKRKIIIGSALFLALSTAQTAMAWYDPSTGRWLTRDPIGEPGSQLLQKAGAAAYGAAAAPLSSPTRWIKRDATRETGFRLLSAEKSKDALPYRLEELNLYQFVHNDPVDSVDPLGLIDFNNAECIAACEAISGGKNKLYQACVTICKTLKGKTCNQLWSYCMHLDRHPCGQMGKMCHLLYLELCAGQ